jgi:large subunit ribosomal protein L7A
VSYEKVLQATKIVIGTKQAVKVLKDGTVSKLIIASDAGTNVTAPAVKLAQDLNIPIIYVDSMKKLGKTCGIEVGASTVAIIR